MRSWEWSVVLCHKDVLRTLILVANDRWVASQDNRGTYFLFGHRNWYDCIWHNLVFNNPGAGDHI